MSGSVTTHFHLKMGDLELSVDGEPEFVEKVYRMLMLDVERVRGEKHPVEESVQPNEDIRDNLIWVHRCSEMLHKIYLIRTAKLAISPLSQVLHIDRLNALYINRPAIEELVPSLAADNTIYAQLTPAGKRKIAEMSDRNHTA